MTNGKLNSKNAPPKIAQKGIHLDYQPLANPHDPALLAGVVAS